MSTEKRHAGQACCFTACVDCDGPGERCGTCGWNPKEHKLRTAMRLLWTRSKTVEVRHENGTSTTCTVQYVCLPRT